GAGSSVFRAQPQPRREQEVVDRPVVPEPPAPPARLQKPTRSATAERKVTPRAGRRKRGVSCRRLRRSEASVRMSVSFESKFGCLTPKIDSSLLRKLVDLA